MTVPKFHLTIGVLKLLTPNDIAKAKKVLDTVSPTVYDALGTRTLLVNVKGIDSMHGNPSQCNVLYAKAEDSEGLGRLDKVFAVIVKAFTEANLMTEQREYKIHATLMNTKYGAYTRNKGKQGRGKRVAMDVTKILERYGEHEFGKCRVPEVRLNELGGNVDADGYYKTIHKIGLP